MNIFVARQAVFDRNLKVDGYELLFRSCDTDHYDGENPGAATSCVIANSLFTIGLERLLCGKRGFINFDRELLLNESTLVLPAGDVVIEILEDVEVDDALLKACRRLRNSGYILALDDFVASRKLEPLIELANIIKVDFRGTPPAEQKRLVDCYAPKGIQMLAEKIETREEFERARAMGYTLFQGYFISRPVVFRGRQIPGVKINYLRLLQEISAPDLNFTRIENLIKQDVSLTYSLLRYVNTASFAIRGQVESIRQALLLIGEERLRKWVSVAALPAMSEEKPQELISAAMIRARFCELLGLASGAPDQQAYLTGMFSLLDAMLDRPLADLLKELSLPKPLCDTLLGCAREDLPLSLIFKTVRDYESAEWDSIRETSGRIGVSCPRVPELYMEAVHWADQLLSGAPA